MQLSQKVQARKRMRRKRLRKKERYNRRKVRQVVEVQDKTREENLRMHAKTLKKEGKEGVERSMRTMRFIDRISRFFHIKF